MRAVSLLQPWASLVATGAKHIETRSWSTPYRGPLAIHASKGLPTLSRELQEPSFVEALAPLVGVNDRGAPNIDRLPRGEIIATCLLVDVVRASDAAAMLQVAILNGEVAEAARSELAFGDYSGGRYAWLLESGSRLEEPVPARGMLGVWEPLASLELELAEAQLLDVKRTGGYRCHFCGCTDNIACEDCCWWAAMDPPTCSSCAERLAQVLV